MRGGEAPASFPDGTPLFGEGQGDQTVLVLLPPLPELLFSHHMCICREITLRFLRVTYIKSIIQS